MSRALVKFTNDWSLYLCDDAEIRFYVKEAISNHEWPDDNDEFILELKNLSTSYDVSDTIVTLMALHERKVRL